MLFEQLRIISVAGTALVAATLVMCNIARADTGVAGISPATTFTPVVSEVLTVPQPVKASDGNFHIAYELVLTNPVGVPVELQEVEIRDRKTGTILLALGGPELKQQFSILGHGEPGAASDTAIASSATAVVWLDVVVPTAESLPDEIDHRVVGKVVTPDGGKPFEAILSPLALNRNEPVVLGPPVAPGKWLMSEGCCGDYTHHRHGLAPIDGRLMVPQRFAIDLFLLDDQNRTWIGDPRKLADYLSYEKPTIAAADGEVVAASDGRPDQQPPEPPPIPPIADTVGNHVIVKVNPTTYLLYAHMKPGSIRVKAGDKVKKGQQIGLIGTTGNSTTPHLHFQILSTPTFFPADSAPYVFEAFDLVGHESERIWDDNLGLQPDGTIPVNPAISPGPRRNVMPLDRDIVVF